jgi:antitoxin (DNA-binding transcriptional repressor) of toxin-antitoxin stability system
MAVRAGPTYGAAMNRPKGFEYVERGEEVVILHHGRAATTLRGHRAADFLEDVESGDAQELMARLTGNYRRGNERTAKRHPRNSGR